jgi:chorismate synthase
MEVTHYDELVAMESLKQNHQTVLGQYYADTENYLSQIEQLKEERDSLRAALQSIALFVSAGMGDENTTAQQYATRIKDGIEQMVVDFSKRT